MSHTAGDWIAEGSASVGFFLIKNAVGERVLNIRGGMIPTAADGRLLAAAPRLLAALEKLLAFHDADSVLDQRTDMRLAMAAHAAWDEA